MHFIVEASPEIFYSLVIVILLYLLTKEKLSKSTRHRILYIYSSGLLITLVLLFQSNTKPINTLNVLENYPIANVELAEVKNLSPKKSTSDESSERLNDLIEKQKQSVSITQDKSDN